MEIAAGALGVALLALVLVAGFAGSQNPLSNFAPTFVFITFWVGHGVRERAVRATSSAR